MEVHNLKIKKLLEYYREISLLGKIKAILDWDLNVNLPDKASEGRANQSAYLSEVITKKWLDKEFKNEILHVVQDDKLSEDEKAILRNIHYFGKYYFKVPAELITEKDKVTSKAFIIWKHAREKNSYADFLPSLKEIIRINQLEAKHLGYKNNLYDALLDEFEPELTVKECEQVFSILKPALIDLLRKIQKSKHYKIENTFINGKEIYDKEQQKKVSHEIMKKMGFDFASGRLDESPHPFTIQLDRYDIRLTTSYHSHDFYDAFDSTMHETGHALYEQNVELSYDTTPLEYGVSLGIHECMSRFWQNMVGKNPGFLAYITPIFQKYFPEQLASLESSFAIKLFNIVKPSFIRVSADEVTYSLHIILRFEMENGLLNGTIPIEKANQVWKEKFTDLLGTTPLTDAEGILQDPHWTYGEFGYFPSYALGNLYGAQFLNTMKKTVAVDEDLKKGELRNILAWCNENIHTHGSRFWPKELIKKVTGEALNPQYFIEYLNEKYAKIYEL